MPSRARQMPISCVPKQALAAVEDALEHRLRVGHRPTDDLQHFGGGRLPLERFARLVEQPHVLDGDYRLVGEGLGERSVGAAERLRPLALEDQHTQAVSPCSRGSISEQRQPVSR